MNPAEPDNTVDAGQLRLFVEKALRDHFPGRWTICRLERRPFAYRTSFAIEELDIGLDDGRCLRLLFKDLGWTSLTDEARRAKPSFLYDPCREIEAYRRILPSAPRGPAVCYGSVVDPASGRYWLLLEKVEGMELYQVGEFETWRNVTRWLARLHAHFVEFPLKEKSDHLLRYDAAYYRRWLDRASALVQPALAELDLRGRWERLVRHYGRIVEELLDFPVTLLHGEFYASNVLVQETSAGLRICPVDWELAALGPGLVDLSALIAGNWTEEQKEALAASYYEVLYPGRGWPPSDGAFLEALDCCRLHLAVQWLGWAAGWRPPASQTQDWLQEALFLTAKLDL